MELAIILTVPILGGLITLRSIPILQSRVHNIRNNLKCSLKRNLPLKFICLRLKRLTTGTIAKIRRVITHMLGTVQVVG